MARSAKPNRAENGKNGATLGFEAKLWQAADKLCNNMDAAEGKKGGQFYTPRCVVQVLVSILAPYKGRVYDPCCGSGGMFVHQSEKFIQKHGGKVGDIHHLRPTGLAGFVLANGSMSTATSLHPATMSALLRSRTMTSHTRRR